MNLEITSEPVESLSAHPENPRQGDIAAIHDSIQRHGWYGVIIAQRSTRRIIAGNHRWYAAREAELAEVPVHWLDVDDDEATRIMLVDNRANDLAAYDEADLAQLLARLAETPTGLDGTGYDQAALDALLGGDPLGRDGALRADFPIVPFSVLDARSGAWQDRKRAWLDLGITSEDGRDAGLVYQDGASPVAHHIHSYQGGTSIFDPVLAELAISWFSPPGGHVLDPCAGGSVRGLVSAHLGRTYTGIDISQTQVTANEQQAARLATDQAEWICGDGRDTPQLTTRPADLLLTCPPYGDLERYSDDPADLSQMTPADYAAAYHALLTTAASLLRPDRFAVIIVGEYRLRDGSYAGLIPQTITAMRDAGLAYHNEAVLVTPTGTTGLTLRRGFDRTRKLGKTHQNVLVFVKGSAEHAATACGNVPLPA